MSDGVDVVVYRHYYPPGVKRFIASGSSAFIGEVDESTVLKYPLAAGGDVSRLKVERELLEIIGPHPRVIGPFRYVTTASAAMPARVMQGWLAASSSAALI